MVRRILVVFFWKYSELTGGSEPLQKESGRLTKKGLLSQPKDGQTPTGRPGGHGVGRQPSGRVTGMRALLKAMGYGKVTTSEGWPEVNDC